MKLSKFNTTKLSNAGVKMFLKDLRTGKDTEAFLVLLGKDSDEFKMLKEERERLIAERVASGKTIDLTQDERDDLACDMLGRCTKGWGEMEDDAGQPLAFSTGAAKVMYLEYPGIREQANQFIADRAHFVQP